MPRRIDVKAIIAGCAEGYGARHMCCRGNGCFRPAWWKGAAIARIFGMEADKRGKRGVPTIVPGALRQAARRPPPAELRTLLEERWAEHERLRAAGRRVPWVFHRDGERIVAFQRSWRTACRAAGVPGRIAHDLRRTAVRN